MPAPLSRRPARHGADDDDEGSDGGSSRTENRALGAIRRSWSAVLVGAGGSSHEAAERKPPPPPPAPHPKRRKMGMVLLRVTALGLLGASQWVVHAYCAAFEGTPGGLWCEESAGPLRSSSRESDPPSAPSSSISSSSVVWPPNRCSSEELQMVGWQLPDDVCRMHERRPWTNRCHLSFETRCPDSTWLSGHYLAAAKRSAEASSSSTSSSSSSLPSGRERRTVVYVGCNKGMDAVNALRMVSNDPTIDKFRWRDAFFENATVQPGHCNQEFEPQFPVVVEESAPSSAASVVEDAQAYCLEAMPVTARHLAKTAERLGWQDRFRVLHAAASHEPGWALFPNPADGKVGVEGLGMDACSPRRGSATTITQEQQKACANVTVTTLDALLANEPGPVDVLSIDVEGHDFSVLLGAEATLPRVRYVEFEYNWKQPWGSQSLREAMDYLEPFGFVCYWAGHRRRAWRITGCWRDAYDRHFWSNVACVNGNDEAARPVALELERMFQETLKGGTELALQIDQEFRSFYSDVVDGYVKNSDGTLLFTRIK